MVPRDNLPNPRERFVKNTSRSFFCLLKSALPSRPARAGTKACGSGFPWRRA